MDLHTRLEILKKGTRDMSLKERVLRSLTLNKVRSDAMCDPIRCDAMRRGVARGAPGALRVRCASLRLARGQSTSKRRGRVHYSNGFLYIVLGFLL